MLEKREIPLLIFTKSILNKSIFHRIMEGDMTKGMLHTLSYTFDGAGQGGMHGLMDISADLTRRLQRMVRQGSIFKLVGIDISASTDEPIVPGTDVQTACAGVLKFYTPTKGRCDAWRNAFFAVQKWRKIQGCPPNYNYDFRVGFDANTEIQGFEVWGDYPTPNQAFIEHYANDMEESSAQGLFLTNSYATDSYQSLFDVWNMGIEMQDGSAAPRFGMGWQPYAPDPSNKFDVDFVKNESALLVTNPKGPQYASLEKTEIGFTVGFSEDADVVSITSPWQWRPVANEYVPVLCGLIELMTLDSLENQQDCDLHITLYISGWKSILPRRKKRKSKKSKKKK